MTRRRLLAVELLGAALREVLPLLRRLADAMDPAGSATSAWGPREPLPDERVYVPAAWAEMDL